MSEYTQKDYEAMEAAVMETPRGRWFLAEFARRNRAADTLTLLEAIAKLERNMAANAPHHGGRAAEQPGGDAPDDSGALTAENLSYFEGDEDLFEAAPETVDDVPAAAPARSLAIIGEAQQRTPPAQPPAQAEAGATPVTSRPTRSPNDRVVFIRRASSKEMSIPLADEADDPVPAARPQPAS